MKFPMFFARPRRHPARPAKAPTPAAARRDWADLPVHHPRED
jgi:hypothetical protein